MVKGMANVNHLKIYFIHSNKIDYNQLIYLPVLRSNVLSHHTLLFAQSEENKETYFKDMIASADLIVVELTSPDMGLNMELKHAILSRKPILALAQNQIGYDIKYQKLLKNVLGYSNEAEFRTLVEMFVQNNKDRVIAGKLDPTLILGELK